MSGPFHDAVKDNTFLQHYLAYMDAIETPRAYDFWCGMWLLSSALGRGIQVARPAAPVYLNLYVVLCADAGLTRKSTAIRKCEAVYNAMELQKHNALITGSATPEALMQMLALRTASGQTSSCNILVSELVTFLGKERYTAGMPGMLTDLYDCPALREYGRLSQGSGGIVRNVYTTFLAASTPAWLIRAINPDVVEGGFTSRCLFVIEERRKRSIAWPSGIAETDKFNACVTSLQDILNDIARYNVKGIELTDNAKDYFIRWYDNRRITENNAFTSSFEAREDHHILRLAGLLACNERSFVINTYNIQNAIKIIQAHKQTAGVLFGDGRQLRRLVGGIDKLRGVLVEAGELGITQTDLLFKTRHALSKRELEYAMLIMHELEMVQQFEAATKGRNRTIWRATNQIMLRNLNTVLQERMQST